MQSFCLHYHDFRTGEESFEGEFHSLNSIWLYVDMTIPEFSSAPEVQTLEDATRTGCAKFKMPSFYQHGSTQYVFWQKDFCTFFIRNTSEYAYRREKSTKRPFEAIREDRNARKLRRPVGSCDVSR